MSNNLDDVLAQLGIDTEKTASAESATTSTSETSYVKLAEDIEMAGALMAESFFNKVSELNKEAADRASSSHASAGGHREPSMWSSTAEKLQMLRNPGMPGDDGHTRAEDAFKRTMAKSPARGGESYA